ncbi:hypothetical protein CR513_09777, partial [Mucuna pruriens]
MVSMFKETLPSPFYDKVVGSVASNFADLVTVGERIESGLKRGRIAGNPTSSTRKPVPERRKGEANVVTIDPSKSYGPGGSSSSPLITLSSSGMIVSTNPLNPNRGEVANPPNIQNTRPSRLRRIFTPIPMTYTTLFHQLLQKHMITTAPAKTLEPPYPQGYDPNAKCEYHEEGPGHTTKNCWALKHRVQDLLEGGWLNFKEVGSNVSTNPLPPHGGTSVNVLDHEPAGQGTRGQVVFQVAVTEQAETPFQKPLTIYYDPVRVPWASLTISVPAQPAYHDNHAAPRRYELTMLEAPKEEEPAKEVTNVAKSGGITRSGRIYTPENLRGKETHAPTRRASAANTPAPAPEKEAEEFLKIIWHSEYQLLDQMNKTPARISLLSLLHNSETHRNLLLKILKEAHVAHDITTERFGSLVNNITSWGHLTFSDDEIPIEGKATPYLGKVLIDNGSSLNVLPKATLDKLTRVDAQLRASSIVVRAFDGSKREVMGEISLPILIGPALFNINFQVMDIWPAYSCLLGQPWIHTARAVLSFLHQQVKFINNHQIISIMGEKELVITTPALEDTTSPPRANMALQIMMKEGYQPGKGLGPHLEGIPAPILVLENPRRSGLGYQGNDSNTEAEALVDIERWIDIEKPKFEAPTKDLESVSLREGTEGREVWIGKQLPPDSRTKLIELLKEYADIFAWSY